MNFAGVRGRSAAQWTLGFFNLSLLAGIPPDMATHTMNASDTFAIGGDLTVNRLGFGAMRLTGQGIWGEPKDPAEAKRVLRRAVELGVNLIDTADSYGPEVSERLIGETLYPYPKDLVIATKGGLTRRGQTNGNRWAGQSICGSAWR